MSKKIYKIVDREVWDEAKEQGSFKGAGIDLIDQYIHFSTAQQVAETAAKHFVGQANLLLVEVDTKSLGPDLKWETSRGGSLFPHLYADLPMSAVSHVAELPIDDNGIHIFPKDMPVLDQQE
ncbi:DUF952 domain-containing protein [Vicingaceae bacterium]|nr:DUF952 domain-containing protein [Vicingaceae bacterium]